MIHKMDTGLKEAVLTYSDLSKYVRKTEFVKRISKIEMGINGKVLVADAVTCYLVVMNTI